MDFISSGLALLFSFIFSGAEIAFLSTNKLQLELQGREGMLTGKVMSFFAKHPSIFFWTSLLGHVMSLVFFIYFLIHGLATLFPPPLSFTSSLVFIVAVITLSLVLVLMVTYLIPKCWTAISPNTILKVVALPYAACYLTLSPLVHICIALFRFIPRGVLKLEYAEGRPLFGATEHHQQHTTQPKEKKRNTFDREIFHNALEFKSVKVRDCMVPRTEITAIDVNAGVDALKQAFVESGHSKIIIFRKTIDDIIGYCHCSSLFKRPSNIQDILSPIIMAPLTTPANELMIRFIHERKNMAVVMDEFGGTSGIVSIEDIIEEIFGEVDNEPSEDNLVEQKLDDDNFLFSGRLEIDYLNKTYDLDLPTGDYDTLGGLILSLTENLPAQGEIIARQPYVFTIQSSQNNRIEIVKVTIEALPEPDPENPAEPA